jgi:hypothetical protein
MRGTDVVTSFRRSKLLLGFTIFLAFLTGKTTVTLVQSLAPALIKSNDYVMFYRSHDIASFALGKGRKNISSEKTPTVDSAACDRKFSRCVKHGNVMHASVRYGEDCIKYREALADLWNKYHTEK